MFSAQLIECSDSLFWVADYYLKNHFIEIHHNTCAVFIVHHCLNIDVYHAVIADGTFGHHNSKSLNCQRTSLIFLFGLARFAPQFVLATLTKYRICIFKKTELFPKHALVLIHGSCDCNVNYNNDNDGSDCNRFQ